VDGNGFSGGSTPLYEVASNLGGACINFYFDRPRIGMTLSTTTPTQCSNLTVTPTGGFAPFNLTIVPDSHPPRNITFSSTQGINWQVDLGPGTTALLALTDSLGSTTVIQSITVARDDTSTACLALARSAHALGDGVILAANSTMTPDLPTPSSSTNIAAMVGSAVGGLLIGALISFLASFLWYRRHHNRYRLSLIDDSDYTTPTASTVQPFNPVSTSTVNNIVHASSHTNGPYDVVGSQVPSNSTTPSITSATQQTFSQSLSAPAVPIAGSSSTIELLPATSSEFSKGTYIVNGGLSESSAPPLYER